MTENVKHIILLFSVFITMLWSSRAWSQLSPGKLTKAHTKLEGLNNCTQCHDIGNKISEQKCLNCHKELKSRITANKGYHVSSQIKGKACIVCHSEHHGINFDMIRFDEKTFNHTLTGYELKGGHKTQIKDCRDCHKPDNITSATIKAKPGTFLGLDQKCLSCHADRHEKTLSSDCTSCHNMNDFKPATLFNHAKTAFPLAGAHQNVSCVSCHKIENKAGRQFQHFTEIAHKNCASCHKDVHSNAFGTNCKACHNEVSFHKISPSKSFNHQVTGFVLEGKHKDLDCKKCHDNRNNSVGSFQEFSKVNEINCATCHEDAHNGKFGLDCKSCHNQSTFKLNTNNAGALAKFDHNKTDFVLEGKHIDVDCRKCHKSDLTDALPHNTCNACHSDYHNNDFVSSMEKYPDCASCHTTDGFSPSLFTLEQHDQSKFKLTGAHQATACFACHFKQDKWVFKNIGSACIDCHKDIHDGFIDKKYYAASSCEQCHSTDAWNTVKFDHGQTAFQLLGKHATIACSQCHIDKTVNPIKQTFAELNKDCVHCHINVHGNQFEKDGLTNCNRCHGFESWDNTNFNHDNTNFPLQGGHVGVECVKCHRDVSIVDGKEVRKYKMSKFECIDCHQ